MDVYAGVDWSQDKLVVLLGCEGQVKKLSVVRSLEGVAQVRRAAEELGGAGASLRVRLEGGDEELALAFFQAGAHVYVTDPKQARRFRESRCSSGAKDDFRDARALLDMQTSPSHRMAEWEPELDHTQSARELISGHEQVSHKVIRATNQLRALLVRMAPALNRALNDLTAGFALALLKRVSQRGMACMNKPEEWEAFCRRHRVRKATRPHLLGALVEPWAKQPEPVWRALALRLGHLVAEIQQLVKQQKVLRARMDVLTANIPEVKPVRRIQGIGGILAAGLVALGLVEPKVIANRDGLSLRCGTSPVLVQSGKSYQVRMRKGCPALGRKIAHLLAMQAIMRLGWAKAQYAWQKNRGKKHAAALRIVARSLLRVLEALVRKGEEYNEEQYIEGLQRHGVPWAKELEGVERENPDSGAPRKDPSPDRPRSGGTPGGAGVKAAKGAREAGRSEAESLESGEHGVRLAGAMKVQIRGMG